MKIEILHDLFLKCESISTDTRKIENNSMFIALKGENFDANTFAKEALNKGASWVIIDNKDFYINEKTILVSNSLETLQELAKYHREYLKVTIVALTGSNGKTTTKELINVVLSKKYRTKATIGNLNNHIGVPLTLLSFNENTEIGIVEMGANHQKEIAFLCEIARPDFGYITNFGKAHLEGFGGVEGVIKGKSEMYDYIEKNNKKVFINLDDALQVEKTNHLNSISFGLNNSNASLNINNIKANPLVTINFENTEVNSNLIGLYNASNINAAITIGKYFNIENIDIKAAIESYKPDNNRSQLINKGSNEIILDAYNANPSSMKVAIENFLQINNAKKLMILGDMFELGVECVVEHKAIVDLLKNQKESKCYFVGKYFYDNKIESSNLKFFENLNDLSNLLKDNDLKDNLILIKGSRGMALEKILNLL
jgi:UDP-N-acetylmuramoyl-tripeptide--D-alanyl-D-alanine ligase